MYAIVEISGKQYRVEKDQRLQVPLQKVDSGGKVEFERVLLFNDDKGDLKVGNPLVDKMKVSATVLEHGREKKIIVFKKKRRKGYQVKNGHRQGFSLIKIDNISAVKAAPKKAKADTAPAEKAVAEDAKPAAAKTAAKPAAKKAKPVSEKTAAKPAARKAKPAAKKADVKPAAKTTKPAAKGTEEKKED
jgi:large subunit ribosomal protein L21